VTQAKPGGGRPRIYDEPMRQITLNLPVEVIDHLDSVAAELGQSRSQTAGHALRFWRDYRKDVNL